MKLVTILGLAAVITLGATAAQAKAKPDKCDAARCAVQSTVNAACPCNSGGHGRYYKCYVKAVKQLTSQGQIPVTCVKKVLQCGSKSTCGRPHYVVCDIPIAGCRTLPTTASCGFAGGVVRTGATSCCTNCSAP